MTLPRRLATMVDPRTAAENCDPARSNRFSQDANGTTMQEINPINNLIKDLSERTDVLRGYL